MKTEYYYMVQGAITAAVAWLSARLGALFAPLMLLMGLMILDYITGMLASKKEAIEHPDDPAFGWSSRKGGIGIIKKVGYMCVIVAAVCLDCILADAGTAFGVDLSGKMIFGLIVSVWYLLNELLSVIENAGRMGAPVPAWLARYIAALKGKIDRKGEEAAEEEQDEN